MTNVKANSPRPADPRWQNLAEQSSGRSGSTIENNRCRYAGSKKAEWRSYLDRIARALIGRRAAIEIRSPQFSNDIQAEWLPLQGISYDPRKDILEVAVSGLKHMIRKPQHLVVEENGGELATLEIIDQDGLSQIVRLREEAARPASVTAVPV